MGTVARRHSGFIVVTAVVRREGKQFVSWCPELDIASCGNSEEEAEKNLGDALELYLNTLETEEEREKVFTERGIQVHFEDEPVVASNVHISQLRARVPTSV